MAAATIDEIIARLEGIIEQSIAATDRRGYFAALYDRVTLAVRAGIAAGEFEDGPRMERLDVVFANRYLDAYDAYRSGAPASACWVRTFDAAARDDLPVLHHLLLGMNAHIALDLGIAAAQVAGGSAIGSLQTDFDRINDVLGSLVGQVESELVSVAGSWDPPLGKLFGELESHADGLDRSAAMLLMDRARSAAWRFATELAALQGDDAAVQARIAGQDRDTALAADVTLGPAPLEARLVELGHEDVAANIRTLSQGEQVAG